MLKKLSLQTNFLIFIKLLLLILAMNLVFKISLVLFDLNSVQKFFIINPLIDSLIGLLKIIFYFICISIICYSFFMAKITLPIKVILALSYFLLIQYIYLCKKYKIMFIALFLYIVFIPISDIGDQNQITNFSLLIGLFIGILIVIKNRYTIIKEEIKYQFLYKTLSISIILLYSINSSAQLSSPKSFRSDLNDFVDVIVSQNAPKLSKNILFLEGMKSHVLEKNYQSEPMQFSNKKAHYHQITTYGKNENFTEIFSIESLGLEFIKETYTPILLKILNDYLVDFSEYDAYYFDIINVNDTDYLVFSLGYRNACEMFDKYIEDFWDEMK